MNLHEQAEFDELLRQRAACGWNYTPYCVETWRSKMDAKTMSLFWIVPTHLADMPSPSRWVGHVGMTSENSPPDPEYAKADKSVMLMTTFFVLPEYRRGGLGRAATEALEAVAKIEPYGSPSCKALTVETLSRKYTEDDGDEWRGLYIKRGRDIPEKGTSIEDWYVRMGFKKWRELWAIHEKLKDGTDVILLAASLRKDLN